MLEVRRWEQQLCWSDPCPLEGKGASLEPVMQGEPANAGQDGLEKGSATGGTDFPGSERIKRPQEFQQSRKQQRHDQADDNGGQKGANEIAATQRKIEPDYRQRQESDSVI